MNASCLLPGSCLLLPCHWGFTRDNLPACNRFAGLHSSGVLIMQDCPIRMGNRQELNGPGIVNMTFCIEGKNRSFHNAWAGVRCKRFFLQGETSPFFKSVINPGPSLHHNPVQLRSNSRLQYHTGSFHRPVRGRGTE
jgi:hypothetical protein